jgi:hypothetical protein
LKPLDLPTCSFLGHPAEAGGDSAPELPPDYDSEPFKYLPPRIVLSEAELDLARRYEMGDFSGGYGTSQIAHFRRGPSRAQHEARRDRFRRLLKEVHRQGLVLPAPYIELVESDDYVTRLRHNTIWLTVPDEVVPLPSNPDHKLLLIFYEGQGCGYWYLLLGTDGSHVIAFSAHGFGLRNLDHVGVETDISSIPVYQCARSFTEWIVLYFADCIEGDDNYDRLLSQWPAGM